MGWPEISDVNECENDQGCMYNRGGLTATVWLDRYLVVPNEDAKSRAVVCFDLRRCCTFGKGLRKESRNR